MLARKEMPLYCRKKKKIFLAFSTKKASQWVAKMTLTSEISLISAGSTSPTEGLGIQHPSPGIWPTPQWQLALLPATFTA